MTPEEILKLSNEELNELIAVKLGWSKSDTFDLWGKVGEHWCRGKDLPDYTGSWQSAGELLEEIIAKMNLTKIRVFKDEVDHQESEFLLEKEYSILTLNWHKSDLKPRKIAEAYAVMECAG